MDNNAVETLAVNTVIESIVLCNYLEPYISDKDKQPSWDGNVYIYKSPQKRKDNILGRIPAQVKGSQLLNPDAECVTFAVDIADLRNYLGDGGLLYFVVAMSHDGAKRTLYYRSFATVNLQMILAEHGMQQTVSLDFSRFPTDSDEKARLCMNLWEDLRKQRSFSSVTLHTLDELAGNPEVEGYEITLARVGTNEIRAEDLLKYRPYLYVRIKGCPIPQPLLLQLDHAVLHHTAVSEVSIDGEVFYSKCEHYKSQDKTVVMIGKSVALSFSPDNEAGSLSIEMTTKLRDLVHDLRFVVAMIKNGGFTYNQQYLPFEPNEGITDKLGANENRLAYYERVAALFDVLHIDQDIDVSTFTDDDYDVLDLLINTILYHRPVASELMPQSPKLHVQIGGKHVLLWIIKDPKDAGRVYLFDFFSLCIPIQYNASDGHPVVVPHFACLTLEELQQSDNLVMDGILDAFRAYAEDDPCVYERGNNLFLLLLMAIDAGGNRTELFKEQALLFAEWLLNTPDDIILKRMTEINRLQAIKRTRELTSDETEKLWQMIDTYSTDAHFTLCAHILLDSFPIAERLIARFSEEDQEQIRNSTIYHFVRHSQM